MLRSLPLRDALIAVGYLIQALGALLMFCCLRRLPRDLARMRAAIKGDQ